MERRERERDASNGKGNKRRKKLGALAAGGVTGSVEFKQGIFLDGVMLHPFHSCVQIG